MRCPPFSPSLNRRLLGTFDYIRLAACAAALQRLEDEHVEGAIAEIGVFRGDTSVVLHEAAPHRELHLFDTFEGFPQEQLDVRIPAGDGRFRDTSAASVRARFASQAPIHMHIGRVPDTLQEVAEQRFAFVMLDLDLSAPTMASLEFFWPRMPHGAYLFVHDYHNPESNWAAKRVLAEFLSDKDEQLIDLPDVWGSVTLRRGAH